MSRFGGSGLEFVGSLDLWLDMSIRVPCGSLILFSLGLSGVDAAVTSPVDCSKCFFTCVTFFQY